METLSILTIILTPYTAALALLIIMLRDPVSALQNRNPSTMAMLALFLWSFIVGIINGNPISTFLSIGFLLQGYLHETVITRVSTNAKAVELMKKVVKLSIVPVAIGFIEKAASYFIDMSFMGKLFWSASYIPTEGSYRIYSLFGNPNIAGGWFTAMLLMSLYLIRHTRDSERRLFISMSVLLAASLLLTGSRGAVMGLVSGLVTYAAIRRDKYSLMLLTTIIASAMLVFFFLPEANRPIIGRTDIWATCFELIREKPITGVGMFGILGRSYEIHAHNLWISVTTMLGFIGLAIYLAFRFIVYKSLYRMGRSGNELVCIMASLQAMFIGHGIVDFTIMFPQVGALFFASSAIIVSLGRDRTDI